MRRIVILVSLIAAVVFAPFQLLAQNESDKLTGPASAPIRNSDRTTSPATSGVDPFGQMMNLGALGGDWVYVTIGKLRGEAGNYNFRFDPAGELSFLNVEGLIRILSEDVELECENLNYESDQQLEARYNVNINLVKEGIRARCGLLVYSFETNTIVLSLEPYVLQQKPNGLWETYNIKSMTITLRPDGSVDGVQVMGLPDKQVVVQLVGAGKELPVNAADQPTTPLRPQEIILNGSAPRPTATPRTANR